MVGHQAIGERIKRLLKQMSAYRAQKVQIVFLLKENGVAIVPTIVEMVVMRWLKGDMAWKKAGRNGFVSVPNSPLSLPQISEFSKPPGSRERSRS